MLSATALLVVLWAIVIKRLVIYVDLVFNAGVVVFLRLFAEGVAGPLPAIDSGDPRERDATGHSESQPRSGHIEPSQPVFQSPVGPETQLRCTISHPSEGHRRSEPGSTLPYGEPGRGFRHVDGVLADPMQIPLPHTDVLGRPRVTGRGAFWRLFPQRTALG